MPNDIRIFWRNAIKNAIDDKLYPFSEAEKGIKTLAGDYTAADKSAVDEFNSTRVSTTFEDGVLTVAASDYPDNLAALATQYGLENITKVVLPFINLSNKGLLFS